MRPCDRAIVLHIVRKIDSRHAALAEYALDAVTIGQRLGERVVRASASCHDVVVHARLRAEGDVTTNRGAAPGGLCYGGQRSPDGNVFG